MLMGQRGKGARMALRVFVATAMCLTVSAGCSSDFDSDCAATSTCEPANQGQVNPDAAHDTPLDGLHDDVMHIDDARDAGGDAADVHNLACEVGTRQCPQGCLSNDVYACGATCIECQAPTNGYATCNGVACDF